MTTELTRMTHNHRNQNNYTTNYLRNHLEGGGQGEELTPFGYYNLQESADPPTAYQQKSASAGRVEYPLS